MKLYLNISAKKSRQKAHDKILNPPKTAMQQSLSNHSCSRDVHFKGLCRYQLLDGERERERERERD